MSRVGAITGVLVGGITVVVWKQLSGGLFDIYEIVPGFIFASVAIVAVTKLTGEAPKDIQTRFEEYERKLETLD